MGLQGGGGPGGFGLCWWLHDGAFTGTAQLQAGSASNARRVCRYDGRVGSGYLSLCERAPGRGGAGWGEMVEFGDAEHASGLPLLAAVLPLERRRCRPLGVGVLPSSHYHPTHDRWRTAG